MKHTSSQLIRIWVPLFALLLLAGCGGGSGGETGAYAGTWSGTTSHGGTVRFTVNSEWITSFQVTDNGASVWIQQPTELEGDSFEAHNSEDGSAPDAPGATVTGLFVDTTRCTGSYTLTQDSQQWSGTYTTTKQ